MCIRDSNSTTKNARSTQHEWQYDLWARLVGNFSTPTIVPVSHVEYHCYNDNILHLSVQQDDEKLFAVLEFEIPEPGQYQLEVELRFLYRKQNVKAKHKYLLDAKTVFTEKMIAASQRPGGIFPLDNSTTPVSYTHLTLPTKA